MLLVIVILLASVAAAHHIQDMILEVSLPSRYERIIAGETIPVESQIILLKGGQTVADVVIEYTVTDKNGVLITKASETKGGTLRIYSVMELRIPKQTPPGAYEVKVTASHGAITKQSSVTLEVEEEVQEFSFTPLMLLGIALLLFFIILLYERHKFKRIEHLIRKVSERELLKKGLIG